MSGFKKVNVCRTQSTFALEQWPPQTKQTTRFVSDSIKEKKDERHTECRPEGSPGSREKAIASLSSTAPRCDSRVHKLLYWHACVTALQLIECVYTTPKKQRCHGLIHAHMPECLVIVYGVYVTKHQYKGKYVRARASV